MLSARLECSHDFCMLKVWIPEMMFFPLFQTPSQDSLSLLDHYHFYLTRLSNLNALIVLDFGLKR